MRKISVFLLPFLFVFQLTCCLAQETLTIPKPLLEIQGENLVIKYDILNSKPGEKYTIKLEVTDSNGTTIKSQSLSGDIGDSIQGGNGKKIIWHFTSDNLNDEVKIYITISLEKHSDKPHSELIVKERSSYALGGLLLQSIALPGLGLSKINNNKPYWIMGITGYGLIITSIIFKGASKTNHNEFLNTNNPIEENFYNKKYHDQKTVSTICAIGAITIWVADLLIVFHASSKLRYAAKSNLNANLIVIPEYNLAYKAPGLNFKYMF